MTSGILLAKLAHDTGFDVELGIEDGWLLFGTAGRPLRMWIKAVGKAILIALSRRDVLEELEQGSWWEGECPLGAAGARQTDTPTDAFSVLNRARLLDRTLPTAVLEEYRQSVAVVEIEGTEVEALIWQRRGQDLFRKALIDYWQGRCAITGIDVQELLRASHAKPWKDASDAERMDVHNGLLLAAHLDAAYDKGLITVVPSGEVITAKRLTPEALSVLNLDKPCRVKALRVGHEPFLQWHSSHVFIDR